MENVYCGSIGVEYMHMYDLDCIHFIRERMEPPGVFDRTPDEKRIIMRRLTKAVLYVFATNKKLTTTKHTRIIQINYCLYMSNVFQIAKKENIH